SSTTTSDGYKVWPSLLLLNPTSLAKNNAVQQLGIDAHALNVEVILVCETWFTPKHIDSLLNINDYVLHRKDRHKRRGGGVCIYVHKRFCSNVFITLPCSSESNMEIIWVKCVLNDSVFLVACCYHPPKPMYNCTSLQDKIVNDVDFIFKHCLLDVPIFIAGDFNDFNCDFITADVGLSLLLTGPMHGTNTIDLVFTNMPHLYSASTV